MPPSEYSSHYRLEENFCPDRNETADMIRQEILSWKRTRNLSWDFDSKWGEHENPQCKNNFPHPHDFLPTAVDMIQKILVRAGESINSSYPAIVYDTIAEACIRDEYFPRSLEEIIELYFQEIPSGIIILQKSRPFLDEKIYWRQNFYREEKQNQKFDDSAILFLAIIQFILDDALQSQNLPPTNIKELVADVTEVLNERIKTYCDLFMAVLELYLQQEKIKLKQKDLMQKYILGLPYNIIYLTEIVSSRQDEPKNVTQPKLF